MQRDYQEAKVIQAFVGMPKPVCELHRLLDGRLVLGYPRVHPPSWVGGLGGQVPLSALRVDPDCLIAKVDGLAKVDLLWIF